MRKKYGPILGPFLRESLQALVIAGTWDMRARKESTTIRSVLGVSTWEDGVAYFSNGKTGWGRRGNGRILKHRKFELN